MASLTGNLVAETYKALLKTIDNDILTASEKQITDGLGGGSNVFIDSQGFLRANKYKVTNGLATQFLKADGSLDSNAYLTSITGAQVITALGFTPVTNQRTLTINGVTYNLTADRSWTVEGTAAVWGNITGTLSNQTDLQNALNAKYNVPAGTISQYIRGDGTLATFPTLPGGLPIGGTAGQILAKIDATDYNTHWIDNFATQTKNEVKLGQTLAKGAAVYVSSANGTNMIVSAASNTSEALSSKTFGLLETGGVTNDFVKCVTFGLLAGLDTSTAQAGDPVWLGVNGALIFGLANKPYAPKHLVYIGVVTRVQQNNGEIFVNIQNGFELKEIHDVYIADPANNHGLFYDIADGLWKNKSIATALGYTPQAQLSGTGFVKASGTTISYDNSTYLTTGDAASTYQRLDRMAINLLASDIQYPNNNAVIAALALKANASNPVFTGNMTISGAEPKLFFTDTDNNPDYTVFIDSGIFYIYDQTNGATRFSIGTTGNISAGVGKSITADSFIKDGGTASQFLKADGTIDSNTYVASSALANYLLISTAASTYQRLDNMAINLLASDTQYPNNNAVIAALALKANAANPVFTGNMSISGAEPKLFFVDTDNNPDYTVFIDSGFFYIYDQTAGATRFQINSSGNISTGVGKSITAGSFVKDGGTASQYLMADGSVTTGVVTGTGTTNYIPKWTSASALGNSLIFDNGTNVGINTATPATILHVTGGTLMTGGWNKTATLQAQYPTLIFNSNASKWGAIGYDHTNAMLFWVNATSDNVNGTGSVALQIFNSGNAQFSNDLTVANRGYFGFNGAVIFTKSNNTDYSRFLYSGANTNVVYTGGTDANNGAFGINNYEDSLRLFNINNAGTASFIGNVLVNGATTLTGIQGGVAVNGTTSSGVVYRLSNTNRGYTYISGNGNMNVETTSGNISLAPNGSPTLTVDSLGRVGIGVVSNGDKLVVFSGASRNVQRFSSSSNGMYNTYASAVGDVGYIGNGLGILSGTIESDFGVRSEGALVFAAGGNNQRIKVFSNGNTFIGSSATDAGYKLDVNGTGRFRIDGLSKFGLDILNNNGSRGAGFYNTGGNNVQLYFYDSVGVEKIVLDGTTGSADFKSSVSAVTSMTVSVPNNTISPQFVMTQTGGNTYSAIGINRTDGTGIATGLSSALVLRSGDASGFPIHFATANNIRMTILSDGSTGIGTIAPTGLLHLFGTNPAFRIQSSNTGNMQFGQWDGSNNRIQSSGRDFLLTQTDSFNMLFHTNSTQRMAITAGGAINLGDTANFIQVGNDSGGTYFETTGNTDARRAVRIQSGNSTFSQYSAIQIHGANQTIGLSTSNTTRLFISNGGFVGIGTGTATPLAPIHASGGTAMSGGWVRTAMLSAVYPVLAFNSNNSKWAGIGYDFSGSQAFIIWVNAGSENVSTGTGALVISGSGAATFNSSVTATSFFESSDLRKKKLIESNPIINGIEKLEAKLYEKDGKIELGYFAQDAELIMPYAVTKNADGFLNLSYREVHTAKIARLEKEVAELKEKLNLN